MKIKTKPGGNGCGLRGSPGPEWQQALCIVLFPLLCTLHEIRKLRLRGSHTSLKAPTTRMWLSRDLNGRHVRSESWFRCITRGGSVGHSVS